MAWGGSGLSDLYAVTSGDPSGPRVVQATCEAGDGDMWPLHLR